MFQFPDVKVIRLVAVASPVSADEIDNTTFEAGWAFSTTVKVSVFPDSLTLVEPPVCAMVKPAISLSTVVTETV